MFSEIIMFFFVVIVFYMDWFWILNFEFFFVFNGFDSCMNRGVLKEGLFRDGV